MSEAMDDILSAARRSRGQVTSVVGTVRILDDTELLSADVEVRRVEAQHDLDRLCVGLVHEHAERTREHPVDIERRWTNEPRAGLRHRA
ncbi:MAG: hypothetical protein HYV07_22530, partial [Deltaproteobacteria bacterium]|nr:hypothetical protein [Deltaproteobacteria bacterium]